MTFDFADFYSRKATWSLKTFGPEQRPAGVIAHIRKELAEIESALAAGDHVAVRKELADVCLLAIDLSWRAGGCAADFLPSIEGSREMLFVSKALKYLHADLEWSGGSPRVGAVVLWDSATRAIGPAFGSIIEAKFAEVQKRTWPDWRTVPADQPIEHVRAEGERNPGDSGLDRERAEWRWNNEILRDERQRVRKVLGAQPHEGSIEAARRVMGEGSS